MLGGFVVLRRMLVGRVVAAADVSALRATAQVQPPTVGCEALDATGAAGFDGWVDAALFVGHGALLLDIARSLETEVAEAWVIGWTRGVAVPPE